MNLNSLIERGRDVDGEGVVATLMFAHLRAVDEDLGASVHRAEMQQQSLAIQRGR